MKKNTMLRAALLVLAFLLAACGGPASPAGPIHGFAKNADGYADISVEELAGMLKDKDFALVNVHN